MSTQTLRSLIRLMLEEKGITRHDPQKESSTAGASLAGGLEGAPGVLAEPDVASIDVSNDATVDSGDGCEEVEDCERQEREDMKGEGSGAGAVAGAIVPLGATATYPAPDSRSPKKTRSETAKSVARAFGGSSQKRK